LTEIMSIRAGAGSLAMAFNQYPQWQLAAAM
jgi:hypothetical protein